MDEKDLKESRLDLAASRALEDFAQRVSRRGVLARLGKFTLGLVGLSLLPNLPVDRTFVGEAQAAGCTDWRLCGIYGYLCTNCCGGSGNLTTCPSCLTRGGFAWTRCCVQNACNSFTISYYDCCGSDSSCRGTECRNHPTPQSAWCSGGGAYQCTIIVQGTRCTS